MSKIVFPASLLHVPDSVKVDLKKIIFDFLWKGKDKVKRSVIINTKCNGGLNMTDIDSFLTALKAAWISRLLNGNGKWKTVIEYLLNKQDMSLKYLLQMNFKSAKSFPVISKLPQFYQDVFIGFNCVKSVKAIELLSDHELLEQPIFGNELFKRNDTCLFFKAWVTSNICKRYH